MSKNYIIHFQFHNKEYQFLSRGGLFGKDKIEDSTLYLIKNCEVKKDEIVLDYGCGYGAIGITLSALCNKVIFIDSDLQAIGCAKENIQKNNVTNGEIIFDDTLKAIKANSVDRIIFNPPVFRGAELILQMIDEANGVLKPGGTLYIIAKKNKGIKRYEKYLKENYGNARTIFKKNGYFLIEAKKEKEIILDLENYRHTYTFENLEFHTEAGVFSRKKIDPGTNLLIKELEIKRDMNILDLGCGSGVIGLYCAGKTDGFVHLTDVNKRAVKTAEANRRFNNITNAEVYESSLFENIQYNQFDLIISNPPFHHGNDVLIPFIEEAYKHLKKTGKLFFIIMRKRGYVEKVKELFGNAQEKEAGEYIIVSAQK